MKTHPAFFMGRLKLYVGFTRYIIFWSDNYFYWVLVVRIKLASKRLLAHIQMVKLKRR